jgi:hypothetical protein
LDLAVVDGLMQILVFAVIAVACLLVALDSLPRKQQARKVELKRCPALYTVMK